MTNSFGIARVLAKAGSEVLEELESGTPNELFHYTDTAGLIEVLGISRTV